MSEPIEFVCSVEAVKTTVDRGIRIYLDLPETAIMQAAMLMECKRMQVALEIVATPITANTQPSDTVNSKKGRAPVKSLRGA